MAPLADPISDGLDELCWAHTGWEYAAWGSVQDASDRTRGQAAAAFASETTGHLPDVRVWKRYVLRWDRQHAWDYYGRDRALDDYMFDYDVEYDVADKAVPEDVPAGWRPREEGPSWEFVHRGHPHAEAVWVCGFAGDDPPHNPTLTDYAAAGDTDEPGGSAA